MNPFDPLTELDDKSMQAAYEGDFGKAIGYKLTALALLPQTSDTDATRARWLGEIAMFYLETGDTGRALQNFELAIELFNQLHLATNLELNDIRRELHHELANLLDESGRSQDATFHYARATELEETGYIAFNTAGLLRRGQLHTDYALNLLRVGDLVLANEHFQRGLEISEVLKDEHSNAVFRFRLLFHLNYGVYFKSISKHEAARTQFELCDSLLLRVERKFRDPFLDLTAMKVYGELIGYCSTCSEAAKQYERAVELYPDFSKRNRFTFDAMYTSASNEVSFATLLAQEGEIEQAKDHYEYAVEFLQLPMYQSHPRLAQARGICHLVYSGFLASIDDWKHAERHLLAAISLFRRKALIRDLVGQEMRAEAEIRYARYLMEKGDTAGAVRLVKTTSLLLLNAAYPSSRWITSVLDAISVLFTSPDTDDILCRLSRKFLETMEIVGPESVGEFRAAFGQFHGIWLAHAIAYRATDQLPDIFFAIGGRNALSLFLSEPSIYHSRNIHIRKYASTLKRVKELRFGLDAFEKDGAYVGEPRGLTVDGYEARCTDLHEMYKVALSEWRAVRRRLLEYDPRLDVFDGNTTMDSIHKFLGRRGNANKGDVLVLLLNLEFPNEEGIGLNESIAIVISDSKIALLELPLLPRVVEHVAQYEEQSSFHQRLRQTHDNGQAANNRAVKLDVLDNLSTCLDECLWKPLRPHVSECNSLHLVTHRGLHKIPFDLSCPVRTVFHYPGLIFFSRLQLTRKSGPPEGIAPSKDAPLLIHSYDATGETNDAVIPFAQVDELFARETFGPAVSAFRFESLFEEIPPIPEPRFLLLSTHGNSSMAMVSKNEGFDVFAAIDGWFQPHVVINAACYGASVSDSLDGDPVGLASAFLLKGSRVVIGATIAVSDFFMPLLVCLFFEAWAGGKPPEHALGEAKAQLLHGSWSEEAQRLVLRSYRTVLERFLRKARPSEIENALFEWPLVDIFGKPTSESLRRKSLRFSNQLRYDVTERKDFVERIAHWLVNQRASLAERCLEVQEICIFVKAFGASH